MIDLAVTREAYKKREIEIIGFVRTENHPADAFTKITRCKILEEILHMTSLIHPVEQWEKRIQ
jgi:hypothetical protein